MTQNHPKYSNFQTPSAGDVWNQQGWGGMGPPTIHEPKNQGKETKEKKGKEWFVHMFVKHYLSEFSLILRRRTLLAKFCLNFDFDSFSR